MFYVLEICRIPLCKKIEYLFILLNIIKHYYYNFIIITIN